MKSLFLAVPFIGFILFSCGHSADSTYQENTMDYNGTNDSSYQSIEFDSQEYDDSEVVNHQNPKPNETSMVYDLYGKNISEGLSDGYFGSNWTHQIENGQISDFKILNTIFDDDNNYVVEAQMHININENWYYDANLKIGYQRNDEKGWVLDNVASLGLNVVSNGIYNDAIKCESNTYSTYLKNNSTTALLVGGRVHRTSYDGSVEKFCYLVPANETHSLCDSRDEYFIDFVVKDS